MGTASVNKPFCSLLLSNLRKEKESYFVRSLNNLGSISTIYMNNEKFSLKYIPVRSTSSPRPLSVYVCLSFLILLSYSLYISPFHPQSPIFLPPSLFLLTDSVINKEWRSPCILMMSEWFHGVVVPVWRHRLFYPCPRCTRSSFKKKKYGSWG